MALLFDENLPVSLIRRLADLWPDSQHVITQQLEGSSDTVVWDHARRHGLTIVSKDKDFHARSIVVGPPPQVVWLRLGNCTVNALVDVLRAHAAVIEDFREDPSAPILIIDG